jgi:hypothetical protein
MSKAKCDCGNLAVWVYAPGFSRGGNPFFCEDCISSPNDIGCSCNWHHMNVNDYHPPISEPEMPEGIEGKDWRWVEFKGDEHMQKITKNDKIWQYLDDRGRPYPCVEYFYDEEGFDDTDEDD